MSPDQSTPRIIRLPQDQLEYVAERIIDEMQSRFTIPSERHHADHEWVSVQRTQLEAKTRMYEKITESVVAAGLIGLLATALGIFAMGFWQYLSSHIRPGGQ